MLRVIAGGRGGVKSVRGRGDRRWQRLAVAQTGPDPEWRAILKLQLPALARGELAGDAQAEAAPAAAGVRLGGPVSAEGVLAAAYDGMRLATLLV